MLNSIYNVHINIFLDFVLSHFLGKFNYQAVASVNMLGKQWRRQNLFDGET